MTLDPTWLTTIFADAGLSAEQAERAAAVALRRIVRRQRTAVGRRPEPRFRSALTADPLVSVNRILGLGDGGLPFYDERVGRVSEVEVTTILTEIGLAASVALGFAKVVVEAVDPETLYAPVWVALGQSGPVALDTLSRLDWTPLRSESDRGLPPLDPGPPPGPGRRGPRKETVNLEHVRANAPLGKAHKPSPPPAKTNRAPNADD